MNKIDLEEFQKVIARRNEAILTFVDKVVALSAGALTITITFKKQVFEGGLVIHKEFIPIAWIAFAGALIFGAVLHLLAAQVYAKIAKNIWNDVEAFENAGVLFPLLLICMTLGFVGGFSMLTAFAIFNI